MTDTREHKLEHRKLWAAMRQRLMLLHIEYKEVTCMNTWPPAA